jgi:hypothetical protein
MLVGIHHPTSQLGPRTPGRRSCAWSGDASPEVPESLPGAAASLCSPSLRLLLRHTKLLCQVRYSHPITSCVIRKWYMIEDTFAGVVLFVCEREYRPHRQ